MRRNLAVVLAMLALLVLTPQSASAAAAGIPFGFDCKDAPTPDMPGEGLASFFERTPDPIPKHEDPFAKGARTTIFEQYGYAGLRWHTYDLGCGPDAARNPDAVIGTALSNWAMNLPLSLAALTSSVTDVAFEPTFLNVFDPAIRRVSTGLHRSLFATWIPAAIAVLGILLLLKARRAALSTTAAAVGWALIVGLVATALFRWPLESGHLADATVTSTLGSVVGGLDGRHTEVKPSVAVASNLQESVFYRSWLAGTLGSTDSVTARKYGPALFKSQALTWSEGQVVQHDPARGKRIIEKKQDEWKRIASEIQASDPAAYEHLTGKRSDTRVGYAILSTLAAFLALPFLLLAALMLLGSFLIVRLAVMMFPAFAVLGILPAGRGLVLGIGRTAGAALVNAVIFGIGAAITVRVLGLILDPQSRLPGWLSLVLMPLFSFVMWAALKPFRRLTAMVSPHADPFGDGMGSFGGAARHSRRWLRQATVMAAGTATGNVAAATAVNSLGAEDATSETGAREPAPERAEARPGTSHPEPAAFPPPATTHLALQPSPRPHSQDHDVMDGPSGDGALPEGAQPTPHRYFDDSHAEPLPPIEPEWVDGEEVYNVYRPAEDANDAV